MKSIHLNRCIIFGEFPTDWTNPLPSKDKNIGSITSQRQCQQKIVELKKMKAFMAKIGLDREEIVLTPVG